MTNPLLAGLRPTHPGELLREDVLPALGQPKAAIARALGVSRTTLHDLIAERQPVTANMALRLGRLTGTTPESWLRMQTAFDLAREGERLAAELDAIPHLAAA